MATCGHPLEAGVGLVGSEGGQRAECWGGSWLEEKEASRGRGQAHLGDDGRGLSLQSLGKREAAVSIQDEPRGSVEAGSGARPGGEESAVG